MRPRTVALAGGGTAGHIYPGLAIAAAYAQACDAFAPIFIGTSRGLESRLVPPFCRLSIVQSGPLFGAGLGTQLGSIGRLAVGIAQARRVLRTGGVDLVIGVGGYASAAALLAARSLRLRTAIYEANTIPGLANRLFARVVDRVYLGFEPVNQSFARGKALVTGSPVRPEIVEAGSEKGRAPRDTGRPARVLVTGGSLGAAFLNARVPELLRGVAQCGLSLEVLHQAGEFPTEPIRRDYEGRGLAAQVTPYIDDMAAAYRWADCAIARAGAGTIGELAVCGLPALLVPLPQAAGDHQITNARAFAEAGGGWWAAEEEWQPSALAARFADILTDAELWMAGSRAARRLARPDAAHAIVADCEAMMKTAALTTASARAKAARPITPR
jgi:UDP-N-acetylglucosamine--N-acetylmuramyl-(pentapeptide) pyrophosphoryl-undecaprenol N-acetylglucosamine transferase